MNPVAIFLIIMANLISAFAIVITRRAGKSQDINMNLDVLIGLYTNRKFTSLIVEIPRFAIKSIFYNKFVQIKLAFAPLMVLVTYLVYAGGYMAYITIGLTLQPIFTGLLSHIWLKELPSKSTVIGAIIMTLGGIWLFIMKIP